MQAELSHNSTKWEILFKVTQFDRILSKQVKNEKHQFRKDISLVEGMIKSYMVAHVKKIGSQRNLQRLLDEESQWQAITGFHADIPHQSTFSRHWNDKNYVEILEQIFLNLIALVGHRKVHLEHEMSVHLFQLFKAGYLPLSTDATFVKLSRKRFDYVEAGYAGKDTVIEFGAKINLMIDALLNMPFNYVPTIGNIHETKSLDVLIKDLLVNSHPWLEKLSDHPLTPLLIIDKGYWNKNRFIDWQKQNIGFIIPRKKKALTRAHIEFLEFPYPKYEALDALVWISPNEDPLRWIVYQNYSTKDRYWDLLTNVTKVSPRTIIAGQKERWPVEEIFKWLKQQIDLKNPLTESWTGFVIHCLIIFILLLLLQYFLNLLKIPKWQENLTELCRQLREHSFSQWSLHRLRIPISFLEGVEKQRKS